MTFRYQALQGHPIKLLIPVCKLLAAGHLVFQYGVCYGLTSGPSMLPTIKVWGEGMWVSRWHRNGRDVEVGDLVMYKIPVSDAFGIKRVIGMPGDYVLLNTPGSGSDAMIQVPQGHCWLVGDNLPASRDSRAFGPLPLALVTGKAFAVASTWPWKFNWIRNPLKQSQETT